MYSQQLTCISSNKYIVVMLRIWSGLLMATCALTDRIYCRSLYLNTQQSIRRQYWCGYSMSLLGSGRSILYPYSNKIRSLIQEESGIAIHTPQSRRQEQPVHGGNYKGHNLCYFSTHFGGLIYPCTCICHPGEIDSFPQRSTQDPVGTCVASPRYTEIICDESN